MGFDKKIVILGAGPAGLGAAYRLKELGYGNFEVYERNGFAGGLSASFKDPQGFWWDIGGHVLFTRYKYVTGLVDKLLENGYLAHTRDARIWVLKRLVPYPFQNNIKYLPKKDQWECLRGLLERKEKAAGNFEDWIYSTFGDGISRYFMIPYNKKVWACPLDRMDKGWIAERVSVPDVKKVLEDVFWDKEDSSWGPNNEFKFPLYGGTGGLFNKFLPHLKGHVFLNKDAKWIDVDNKKITFEDGSETTYDFLISTIPLDVLVKKAMLRELYGYSKKLEHNGIYAVGIGVKGRKPADRCWMYFPEQDSPFYRITYFANYSPNNVPGKKYFSLLTETSYSKYKKVRKDSIIEETIDGLVASEILKPEERKNIVSRYLIDVEYAYPIPTLGRDAALKKIQACLMERGIYSRGRFGAWRYEIGNMDHSIMQGKEAVDAILHGAPEAVWASGS